MFQILCLCNIWVVYGFISKQPVIFNIPISLQINYNNGLLKIPCFYKWSLMRCQLNYCILIKLVLMNFLNYCFFETVFSDLAGCVLFILLFKMLLQQSFTYVYSQLYGSPSIIKAGLANNITCEQKIIENVFNC